MTTASGFTSGAPQYGGGEAARAAGAAEGGQPVGVRVAAQRALADVQQQGRLVQGDLGIEQTVQDLLPAALQAGPARRARRGGGDGRIFPGEVRRSALPSGTRSRARASAGASVRRAGASGSATRGWGIRPE